MRTTAFFLLVAVAVATGGCPAADASRAIDAIENDLVADDPAVRAKAAAELTDRFPDGAVAVPMLVDLLDDESPAVVTAAARTIDALAVQAVPEVVGFYSEHDAPEFRRRIAALPALLLANPADWFDLDPKKPFDAADAATAAVLAARRARQIPWFNATALQCFARSDGRTRTLTAASLALFGAEALAERRIAPSPDERRAAAGTELVGLIRSNDPADAIVGARLAERLCDASPEVVAALADSLAASRALPKEWKEFDGTVVRYDRIAAADALAAIGAPAASAAPSLIAVVRDSQPEGFHRRWFRDAQARSVLALVRIGREGDLRPLLDERAADSVHLAAAAAKAGCSPVLVLDRLVAGTKSKDTASDAFEGLTFLGAGARPALAIAQARLREPAEPEVRVTRAETILAIAPDDAESIAVLLAALDGQDVSGSHSATDQANNAWDYLCNRAAPTPDVVECIRQRVTKAFSYDLGVEALGRAGPLAAAAVPSLVELASRDTTNWPQAWATSHRPPIAVALGRIGPAAAAAIPILESWKKSGDETIRVPAAQALRRIKSKK